MKRLQKERAALNRAPLPYCTFRDDASGDGFRWRASLEGPPNTPYAGGTFDLDFDFPTQYPFKPPKIRFITPVYHPNVKTDTGEICADLVSEGWGPTLNVRHCAEVLYGCLKNPNSDSPIEEGVAEQMRERPAEYEKEAKRYTREHAM